jgi:hypothetical protein
VRAARGMAQPMRGASAAGWPRQSACGKAAMISTGMARAYSGSEKPSLCQEEPLRRACTNVPCPGLPSPALSPVLSYRHQQSIDMNNPDMRGRRPPAPNQHRLYDAQSMNGSGLSKIPPAPQLCVLMADARLPNAKRIVQ